MKLSLNGQWRMRKVGDSEYLTAAVPGCNYLDLMNNGVIDDPFAGTNEKKAYGVCLEDWEYEKTFVITKQQLQSDSILLRCDMLDTLCDIYIADIKIAHTHNCHVGYSFEVKEYLKEGENTLRLVFSSPVNYVKKIASEKAVPPNSNGMNGIVFIRKPQCHFGWDWGPVLPCSGITRDICLELCNKARLNEIKIQQTHSDGRVALKAICDITDFDADFSCRVTLIHPDGTEEAYDGAEADFTVEKPQLWWTYELSKKDKQPLYTVRGEVFSEGQLVSSKEYKIGLRSLYLDRSRDTYGSNFCFILNGVPLFIKGANFIPADSFVTRFDSEKINKLLESARFSGFNLLRIWGGGYYESDELYNKCDEMGILLWQDFAFACQPYPFFEEDFLCDVKQETEYNVKRLRHHPCLALWCGNNEIETMSGGWMNMRKYIKWTEIFFYDILEKEIRKYDGDTSFIPGSPCGRGFGDGINSDNVGDTHLWSVWHGMSSMKQYRTRMTRFCSEFGFESLPDIKAIEKFAREEDYSLFSEVFLNHQKCMSGNDKMLFYIRSRFNLPKDFRDFIYLSQVTQMECIRDATEHWRRNRGRCNGAVYWQFNDCWPVCSWSGMDYYGNYKALQYAAKSFNEALCVSLEDTEDYVKIFTVNDYNEAFDGRVIWELFDFEKGVAETSERSVHISALESREVMNISMKDIKSRYDTAVTGLRVTLEINGERVSQRVLLFDNEKNLSLPKAALKAERSCKDGVITLTVSSDKFARLVRLSSPDTSEAFSDNYFDLLPGEERKITLRAGENVKVEIMSLTDIPVRKITPKERWRLTKMMLSPMNIGNCIFHRAPAKDVKFDNHKDN